MLDIPAEGVELPAAFWDLSAGSPTNRRPSPFPASPSLVPPGPADADTDRSLSPAFRALSFSRFFWLFERPLGSDPGAASEPAQAS